MGQVNLSDVDLAAIAEAGGEPALVGRSYGLTLPIPGVSFSAMRADVFVMRPCANTPAAIERTNDEIKRFAESEINRARIIEVGDDRERAEAVMDGTVRIGELGDRDQRIVATLLKTTLKDQPERLKVLLEGAAA